MHFVRHGETVWHAENRYAGVSDIALTEKGRAQATALAAWVARTRPDRVIASSLTRAIETATPATDALGIPLHIDPRLREVDFGRGEGMTNAEMAAAFPEERAQFVAAPASRPLPGGETGSAAVARGSEVLIELREDPAVSTVVLVSHTTLVRLMLCWSIGLPLDGYRRTFPKLDNGAVTTLQLPDSGDLQGAAALLRLNVPTS